MRDATVGSGKEAGGPKRLMFFTAASLRVGTKAITLGETGACDFRELD